MYENIIDSIFLITSATPTILKLNKKNNKVLEGVQQKINKNRKIN